MQKNVSEGAFTHLRNSISVVMTPINAQLLPSNRHALHPLDRQAPRNRVAKLHKRKADRIVLRISLDGRL